MIEAGHLTGPESWTMKLNEGSRIIIRVSRRWPNTIELGLPGTLVSLTREETTELVDGLLDMSDMLEAKR